jgi:peptidoglycan/LPS O-acetylase OafA/YrhL
MRYNPALDGLRAVAISLVMLFHAEIIPGGWIGVDVFFVLSGYLITSILAGELQRTGSIGLGRFYVRRALRLTPALLVLVAFQLTRSAFRADGEEIRYATLVGATYIENWNSIFHFAPFSIMGHTWSLATEEQFYLLWPLALPLVIGRRPLVWICAGIASMMATRVVLHGDIASLTFGLYARPVGLLVGCALAMLPPARLPAWTPFAALCALMALGLVPESGWLFVAAPIIASLATAAIIVSAQSAGLLSAMLAWRPAVYVGRISYGLYLYSAPLAVLGHGKGAIIGTGLIGLSFIVAAVSFEIIEKPALRLKDRLGERAELQIAVAAE